MLSETFFFFILNRDLDKQFKRQWTLFQLTWVISVNRNTEHLKFPTRWRSQGSQGKMSSHRSNVPEELCIIYLQEDLFLLQILLPTTVSRIHLSWRTQIYHGFNGTISLVQPLKASGKKNICQWCLRDSPDTRKLYKRGKKGPPGQAWGFCKHKSPTHCPGYQKQGSTRLGVQVANWFSGGRS